jgi:hypothetical protein
MACPGFPRMIENTGFCHGWVVQPDFHGHRVGHIYPDGSSDPGVIHDMSFRGLCQICIVVLIGGLAAVLMPRLISQTAAPASQTAEQAATLVKVTALRDSFVGHVRAAGFTCRIAAPSVQVQPVASFGDYDDATNTVATTDWSLLPPEQRAMFSGMAGPGADEAAAHAMFEDMMHRWMLVHEFAHWWQACRGQMKVTSDRPAFKVGLEADRITLAYWRDVDPTLVAKVTAVTQGVLDHVPNPVPAGENYESYFNKNYETIPPPIRPWFASHMVQTAMAEKPAPTFAQTLNLPMK